jgi:hypothetical protein
MSVCSVRVFVAEMLRISVGALGVCWAGARVSSSYFNQMYHVQNLAVLIGERELLHVATSPLGGGRSGRFRRRAAMLRDSCHGVASTGCTKNVHVSRVFD